MSFQVLLHPKAVRSLEKLPRKVKNEVKRKMEMLVDHPRSGKRLRYTNFWSLRIGDYRVIYEICWEKRQIIVLFIGHRKNVYEDFSKLF
jgi:mRNA interferase RelE/StbE